jgi:Na+-translocating ferredoxin:NAD+ oxidoreductase subunit B
MTIAILLLAVACLALIAAVRTATPTVGAPDSSDAALIERVDALLPQTQCGQCNYAGCRPYATAIALGLADIDQCPPGGQRGVDALARLLNRASKPLNPAHGIEAPRAVALIDEAVCIGCTKCIQVCPVDAILGAPKLMHTVIAAECTGCGLCLPPCPVDCISLPLAQTPIQTWGWPHPKAAPG